MHLFVFSYGGYQTNKVYVINMFESLLIYIRVAYTKNKG